MPTSVPQTPPLTQPLRRRSARMALTALTNIPTPSSWATISAPRCQPISTNCPSASPKILPTEKQPPPIPYAPSWSPACLSRARPVARSRQACPSTPLPVNSQARPASQAFTSRFPAVHGAPIHVGDPAALGIHDLQRPDFGDAVPIAPGEVPVFWACGVTPQAVIMQAKPVLALTHAPGHMFISERGDSP